MTSGSPSSAQADTSGKRRLTVDIGLATIIAACILAGGGVGGIFIGRATTSGTTPTLTTSKENHGPASVTIGSSSTGDIPYYSTLHGRVFNLQAGQLVWTFFQPVNASGSYGSQTYPTAGPCTVNLANHAWACSKAYIGKLKDNGIYRVCAAILNFSEAYTVVKLIENTYANMNLPSWFASPPAYVHDNSRACTSFHRIN
jgi:hypothetical protein